MRWFSEDGGFEPYRFVLIDKNIEYMIFYIKFEFK